MHEFLKFFGPWGFMGIFSSIPFALLIAGGVILASIFTWWLLVPTAIFSSGVFYQVYLDTRDSNVG